MLSGAARRWRRIHVGEGRERWHKNAHPVAAYSANVRKHRRSPAHRHANLQPRQGNGARRCWRKACLEVKISCHVRCRRAQARGWKLAGSGVEGSRWYAEKAVCPMYVQIGYGEGRWWREGRTGWGRARGQRCCRTQPMSLSVFSVIRPRIVFTGTPSSATSATPRTTPSVAR